MIFIAINTNADFRFFPGIEGAREVYLNEDFDSLALPQYSWDKLLAADIFGIKNLDTYIDKANKIRKKSGVVAKIIVPLNDWTKHVISYQAKRNKDYLATRKFRYIDNPIFDMYLSLIIKGNFIRMVCEENDEVWGLVIKSEALAKSLKSIFHLTWQLGEPVTTDNIKSWR